MTLRQLLLASLLICTGYLSAQSCNYQLILEDLVRGDGWNGGQVTLRVGGVPTVYTLGSGSRQNIFFAVTDGQTVSVDYLSGPFPEENSFRILDNDDNEVYTATAPATGTNLTSFTVACTPCAAPPLSSIDFFRVRFDAVSLRFRRGPAATQPLYIIEYGEGNFDPEMDDDGQRVTTRDSTIRIGDLAADQQYSFYVSTECEADESTSTRRGPFVIQTQLENDLGITLLESPTTGCDINGAELTVGIFNYGGAPQQFFRIGYDLNGSPVSINYPFDGIYTGVVGVDSTEFFTFDQRISAPTPGRYQFEVYTLLDGDEDRSNDRLRLSVVNQGIITDFPYTENFEEDDGLWVTGRAGRNPISWAWGEPNGDFFDRAPQGRRAWVTNLNGDYFNGEESYLISPCFDFTEMEEDPYLSFALQVMTEAGFDNLRLEMTLDEGETWNTVEVSPADINWYNDRADNVWEGDGGFGRPVVAANLLAGAAGRIAQLRFVFESDLDDTQEGVLIDAVTISERAAVDVAAVEIDGEGRCADLLRQSVSVTYQNVGTSVIDTILVSIAAGGATFRDTIIDRLAPGNTRLYENSFADMNMRGSEEITVTISAPRDANSANDIIQLTRPFAQPIPFFEDFDAGLVPQGWFLLDDAGSFLGTNDETGSPALVVTEGMAGDASFFTTAVYDGPFMAMDSLRFEVTTDTTQGVSRLLILTTNCNADVIDTLLFIDTLTTGSYAAGLPLELPTVQFRFSLQRVNGEQLAFFDNINVARCPESLALGTDIVPATSRTAANAVATVLPNAGTPPYTYQWSTEATTQTVFGLAAGDYTVTVTDRFGCQDSRTVTILNFVDTEDPEGVLAKLQAFPNPTDGLVNLTVDLPAAEALRLEVYDATGRRLRMADFGRLRTLSTTVDMRGLAPGLYLLRVQAGGAARTLRLLQR